MYHVISIVVDSLRQDYCRTNICKITPTPFIDSLAKESITALQLYSPGPFTDTGTRSLFSGRDCLSDYSFYFKYSTNEDNHYSVFKKNGYETIGLYYPYYICGKAIYENVDNLFYTSAFMFDSEWGGIFNYYTTIIKERELNEVESLLLDKRILLMFEVWERFYSDILKTPECARILKNGLKDVDINDCLLKIRLEHEKYLADKKNYLLELLSKGMNHSLANIDKIDIDASTDKEYIDKHVFGEYKDFWKKAKMLNFLANVFNNKPSFPRTYRHITQYLKTKDIDCLKVFGNYLNCLFTFQYMDKKLHKPHWKYEPSAKKHLDTALYAIDHRNTSNPFYLSVHVEDPHNYLDCFSFDIQDVANTNEEMDMLKDYVGKLGKDFKGNLLYILSIRYVDYCIERFCSQLKKRGLWDKTILLITADHGSSYGFYPLHGNRTNCFDEESYHIPMIIRKPHISPITVKGYYNSKDIYPTLFDILGIEKPKSYIGHSMLDESYQAPPYVLTEYPGGGAPDLLTKKMWLSCRDNRYTVSLKIGLYESFEKNCIFEVFDRTKDPYCYTNIKDSIEIGRIQYLIDPILRHRDKIKIETIEFIERLKNNNIPQLDYNS